ncbi:hypothetical protein [Caulobacter sp. 17J65-9]|uniref:hypothetical protein n=1 Tax=Caulobacter sp. 17J65-9 TaxID=2709382 RepID=UPI0013CD09A6|nr:hypothetical protein [Caulobacter sp. 17J65-9]NEX91547.1 hypothetical protein [Caulobacter sp. 17J65-9]
MAAPAKGQKREADWLGFVLEEARRRAPQALALMTPAGQAAALATLISQRREPAPRRAATATSAKMGTDPRGAAPARRVSAADRFVYEQLTSRDPIKKAVAGYVTREMARSLGMARGGLHAIEDTAKAAELGNRLRNPVEVVRMAASVWDARDQLRDKAAAVADSLTHPQETGERAAAALQQFWIDHDHWAAPQADNVAGEIIRNGPIGVNDGELAVDLYSMLRGGPGIRALTRGALMTEADWVAKRASRAQAKVFVKPYGYNGRQRRGHHSPVAVNSDLGKKLSKKVLDSPFNVVTYKGLSVGEALKHHYGSDKHVRGGKIGGVRWNGDDLGFRKYGIEERLWHGTPEATRDLIIAGLLGPVLLNDASDIKEEGRE